MLQQVRINPSTTATDAETKEKAAYLWTASGRQGSPARYLAPNANP